MYFESEFRGSRWRRNHRRGRQFEDETLFFASEGKGFARRGRQIWGEWGNERRFSRGDIKYVLLTLLEEKSQHGYQLIKEIESRHGGFYKPSPGSVYPTLQMLEEGGYITGEEVEGKRIYTITESGRQLLADRSNSIGPIEQLNDRPQLVELKNAFRELKGAVMQVGRSGNSDKIIRVRELLNRVKREIYTILSEE